MIVDLCEIQEYEKFSLSYLCLPHRKIYFSILLTKILAILIEKR